MTPNSLETDISERLQSLTQAQIPVCTIRRPNLNNNFGDDKAIEKYLTQTRLGDYALNAGNHGLIVLDNPLPHHPDGSQVIWIVEKGENGIKPWKGKESWNNLLKDKEFLNAAQTYLVNKAALKNSPIYMYFGYYQNDHEKIPDYVIPRGKQTISRAHFHEIPQFRDEHYRGLKINLADPKLTPEDMQKIAFFSNIAGLAAETFFNEFISDFSNMKMLYKTPLKSMDVDGLSNNIYGFSSFEEALGQTIKLNEKVGKKWLSFCQELYNQAPYIQLPENLKDKVKEILIFFKQSIIFNASFIFPSPHDMQIQELNKYPVWVSPFSIATVPELLKGIIIERKIDGRQ